MLQKEPKKALFAFKTSHLRYHLVTAPHLLRSAEICYLAV